MGMFSGTASEARRLAMSLSSEFDGNSYNLFTKYVEFRVLQLGSQD